MLSAYKDGKSWPPEAEAELESRENSALSRTETPTGVHNLRRLVALAEIRGAANDKDRADRAESRLAEREREDREFWRNVKVGLAVSIGSAVFLALCGLLYELSMLLPH